MTIQLPLSGRLTMSDIKGNLEITSNANISMGSALLRALAGKKTGTIKLSDFYGANELESLIKAGNDDNGQARGFYRSFWGENDRPQFGTYTLVGVYDAFDTTPNHFVFAVEGNIARGTAFRALVMNNVIFYEADATTFNYDAGSNVTTWEWANIKANLQLGVVYELSYLMTAPANTGSGSGGSGGGSVPPTPTTAMPMGQGTDWTLAFEDNFDGSSIDTAKWNTSLWFLRDDTSQNPPGIQNWDVVGGRLRLWPLLNAGTWVQRDMCTDGKFEQVDGYWEAKLKVPNNPGIRCTFWLFNYNTADRPLIVGMSAHPGLPGWVDDATGVPNQYAYNVYPATDGVVEFEDYDHLDLTADHVYGVKKNGRVITWYRDGVQIATYTVSVDMPLPLHIVVTLDYNSGTPDGNTIQNASGAFSIEYVRAWTAGATNPPPSGGGTGGGSTPPPTPAPSVSNYVAPVGKSQAEFPRMTFRDEFAGTTLDTTKWTNHMWYEVYNNRANIAVANGTLYMWPTTPLFGGVDHQAHIDTDGKFYQKYGYFEVRAKLPVGRGCWPSFWLYNHDLSNIRPEIDVFEAYSGADSSTGNDFANAFLHPIRYAATVWSEAPGVQIISVNSANKVGYVDLSADWHTYAVHWKLDYIGFYMDGILIGEKTLPSGVQDMDMRMFLNLDLWTGGISGQANTNETPLEQGNSLMVDYVRAWALADGSTIVEGTLPPLPADQGGSGGTTSGSPAPSSGGIVAFVGNSTTWGYKSNVGGQVAIPYPKAFASAKPTYDVRNHGINSTTTAHWIAGTNGVPQTFAAFMAANPTFKYVCLDFGSLDQFDMDTTVFKNNLKTMIVEIRKVTGRTPILITPFANIYTGTPAYAQAMRDCGAEVGVAVIDKYTWSVGYANTYYGGNFNSLCPDGIHPTDQAYIDAGGYIAQQWDTAINFGGGASAPPPTGGGGTPATPTPAVPAGHPYTYTLVLNEEFDGSTLNANIWNDHIWWNEAGEKTGKPVNWQVSNGALSIWPADGFAPRTIDTDGKFYQTYGFFEAEMKLSIGRGSWPAFWLYNHDGSLRPEIDIMEAYSGGNLSNGGQTWGDANMHPIDYGISMHRTDGDTIMGNLRPAEHGINVPDLSAGFHKYGCLWEPDGVTFFFDGQQIASKVATTFYDMRMYILLDIYFGSASGTPSDAETPKGIGNATVTRYVRVWRKN